MKLIYFIYKFIYKLNVILYNIFSEFVFCLYFYLCVKVFIVVYVGI